MAEEKKEKSKPIVKKEQPRPRAISPFEEMDKMFEDIFGRTWPRSWMHPFHWEFPSWSETNLPFAGRLPRVDVIEHDNDILVRAEVPGVSKDDLEITTTENTVTIRGCTRYEEKEEKGDYYRAEMSRGEFTRTVALPSQVDSNKASAKLEDGILELTLPKVEKAKRKTIEID